jgi:hypothetical protein
VYVTDDRDERLGNDATANDEINDEFNDISNIDKPKPPQSSSSISHDSTHPDHHEKLLEIWNILEYPFQSRLAFMSKYSTIAYAAELMRAIEVWQAFAVLVITKQAIHDEIVKFEVSYQP